MQSGALTREVSGPEQPLPQSCLMKSVSPSTRFLFETLDGLARNGTPLLIIGESGTGKRTLALAIHRISGLAEEHFRCVECGNSHSTLDATIDLSTHKGTVFFRDIDRMSANEQLQTLEVFFTGSDGADLSHKVRVMASSRRTLDEQVRASRFLEDLYYRISPFCLCVPPLRQRKQDIPLLIDHFVMKYSALLDRPFDMSSQTLELLCAYSWPGNIRELEQVVRTIVAIGDDSIALAVIRSSGFKSMTRDGTSTTESLSLKRAARDASRRAEREIILNTLSRTHWNRKRAARELQISYKALLYKLKQIGIDEAHSPGVQT